VSRVEPCPHRPPCPGCPRYGEPGIAPAALEALDELARDAGLAAPRVAAGAAFGFRHRARLMVRGRPGSPKIGIFREGTHEIVDIPRCRVHHPLVNEVAAAAREAIRATGVRPYADRTHAGTLRAIQVAVERASRSAQVVLVANAASPDSIRAAADALTAGLGASLHSLWWNGQPEHTNAILGPRWERLAGPEAVRESIGGADVFFPPGAFGQSHLDLADRLVARVHEWVSDGARVAEFYCGAGPIGLGLLRRAAHVAFVESAPGALRGLELGLGARPGAERARAAVFAGEAGRALAALDRADVAIVDPPRKGLDAELAAALAASPPGRVVYVSCDVDSLRRDLAVLGAEGRLRLVSLEAWALFPNTEHVEALAVLDRAA
jgi:tRNA/tmRNA/rRNA uracil-C5-methylase (TrmA/RlmC/RlmD family)